MDRARAIGYLPEDPVQLRDELDKRQLKLVAGFIFESLHDAAERPNLRSITHRTCRLFAALDAKYYVLIDNLPAERVRTAGRSQAALRLPPEARRDFMTTLRDLASIARDEYGLSSVIHPHVGGYLEFEDEIDAALADLPEDLVGLCIDTGHSAYAGGDPIALYRRGCAISISRIWIRLGTATPSTASAIFSPRFPKVSFARSRTAR